MEVQQVVTVTISAKEKKSALSNLKAVRKLFGPKGKNWIQGDENGLRFKDGRKVNEDGEDKDGNYAGDAPKGQVEDTFCLIGALKEANGPGQNLAFAAVLAAIDGSKSLEDVVKQKIEDGDIDLSYRGGYDDIEDDLAAYAEDQIPEFNDNDNTTFAKVTKILDKAEAMFA